MNNPSAFLIERMREWNEFLATRLPGQIFHYMSICNCEQCQAIRKEYREWRINRANANVGQDSRMEQGFNERIP